MRRLLRSWFFALAIALVAWGSTPVLAEETLASDSATQSAEGYFLPEYQDPGDRHEDSNPVGTAIGLILKLGAVVGLIYAFAWAAKKGLLPKGLLGGSGGFLGGGRPGLRVLETLPLKGLQTLHVVEVGDRVLVLGSNGRETLVKLAEWSTGSGNVFGAALERAETVEGDFTETLETTLRQVIREQREP